MSKIKTAIFPVAGLGTRFLPATKSIPKEMLVVVDKPLIQYAVEEAKEAGIERFIFVTSQGKVAIEDHFDKSPFLEKTLNDRNKTELLENIRDIELASGAAIYIRQRTPRGLGHAILCAKNLVDEENFAVVLADDLVLGPKGCLKQMVDAYQPSDGHLIAVVTIDKDDVSKYGILEIKENLGNKIRAKSIVEKPSIQTAPSSIAVSGRYILNASIFKALEKIETGVGNEVQLTDALQSDISTMPVTGFLYDGYRYDCGTKTGLLEANIAFSLKHPETKDETKKILKRFL